MNKKTALISVSVVSVLMGLALMLPAFGANTGNPECKVEDHYPLISKSDLAKAAADKSAFIIDVNSKDSFAQAHVPTAINYAANEKNFAKVLPADKSTMIVAYCGSVQCTAWKKAAERACNMGYTNIHHFKEGIKGWTEGQPGSLQ